jgi:hypothetical protein
MHCTGEEVLCLKSGRMLSDLPPPLSVDSGALLFRCRESIILRSRQGDHTHGPAGLPDLPTHFMDGSGTAQRKMQEHESISHAPIRKKTHQNICEKINQKYKCVVHVIIYHHAKLELQQVLVQGTTKESFARKKERKSVSTQLSRDVTVHCSCADFLFHQ